MKYYKLVLNARNPKGFWGKMMIRNMNKNHFEVTGWGLSHCDFKDTDITLDVGCGGGHEMLIASSNNEVIAKLLRPEAK